MLCANSERSGSKRLEPEDLTSRNRRIARLKNQHESHVCGWNGNEKKQTRNHFAVVGTKNLLTGITCERSQNQNILLTGITIVRSQNRKCVTDRNYEKT